MSSTIPKPGDRLDSYILIMKAGTTPLGGLWHAEDDRGTPVLVFILQEELKFSELPLEIEFNDTVRPAGIFEIVGGSVNHDPAYIVYEELKNLTSVDVEHVSKEARDIIDGSESESSRPRKVKTERKLSKKIEQLVEELGNKSHLVRAVAAKGLGELGVNARSAVPQLMDALFDSWSGARSAAAEALGKMGPAAKEAVPFLIQLLDNKSDNVRQAAIEALGNIGEAAKEAIPLILDEIENPVSMYINKLRSTASNAAAMMAEFLNNEEILRLAKIAAEHKGRDARKSAMLVLKKCAPFPPEIVPALSGYLISALTDDSVSAHAEGLLIRTGFDAVTPLSRELGNMKLSYKIAAILADIGSVSMPVLIDGMESENAFMRGNCAWALGRIGPAARIALPNLFDALKDENPRVRNKAAWAMVVMGNAGESLLEKAVVEDNPHARSAAKKALRKMQKLQ